MAKVFKKIFLLFAVVLLFAVSIQARDKKCPPNQEWNNCGSACPRKCGKPAPAICTYQCIIGCQCSKGYMLKSNGECVAPKDC